MKARVLVIEDDPTHLDVLLEALEYCQFSVKTMGDGTDLLKVIAEFKPDLILTDYRLPRTNGQELCKELKKDSKFSSVPVILMSAYPLDIYGLDCFDDILPKPLDLDTLVNHIKKLLPGKTD